VDDFDEQEQPTVEAKRLAGCELQALVEQSERLGARWG
jgi:hypothetical protein